jgi:hypothetical protein
MCEPEPYVVVICIVIGIALAFVTLKLIKFFLDRLDRKEEIIEQRLLEVINAWPKTKYTCSRCKLFDKELSYIEKYNLYSSKCLWAGDRYDRDQPCPTWVYSRACDWMEIRGYVPADNPADSCACFDLKNEEPKRKE